MSACSVRRAECITKVQLWMHDADVRCLLWSEHIAVIKIRSNLLPWQRSTYSGRFLRAVCTTSKLPLPIQYMNVGRKSVARLQRRKHTVLHCEKSMKINKSMKADGFKSDSLTRFPELVCPRALWTYLGLFWMQRRARLKAMFRHSSSEEAMSLCRWFCKQWHKAVIHVVTADGYFAWPFVSVVFDSQWSTGWSLGSSSTSHPPLSTLPTRLKRTGGDKIYSFDPGLKCEITVSQSVTLDCLSLRHLFQVHCHVRSTQGHRGRYVDKREGTSRQVIWHKADMII